MENIYKILFDEYLTNKISVDDFILKFMQQWKTDRDDKISGDKRFHRIIDRVFTSCDCYSKTPTKPYEIGEKELRQEVALLNYIWFE